MVKDLVLVPVHTKPEDSEKEVDELYDVVMAVKAKWKTNVSESQIYSANDYDFIHDIYLS